LKYQNVAIPCKWEVEVPKHGNWKVNMAKCSKYNAKCKVTMPKCSKYHAKWQILVPNCCKHKEDGTRKERQQKFQNLSKKIKKLFCTHSEMPEITLLFFTPVFSTTRGKNGPQTEHVAFFQVSQKRYPWIHKSTKIAQEKLPKVERTGVRICAPSEFRSPYLPEGCSQDTPVSVIQALATATQKRPEVPEKSMEVCRSPIGKPCFWTL